MSIRARLLLLVLVATLLPALLIAARFVTERQQAVRQATEALSIASRDVAAKLDDRVRGTAQLHYGLARSRDLDSHNRAMCSAFLSSVREAYPQYTGILTIMPDGRLFCDSLRTGRELDLRDRGYFREALTSQDKVVMEPAFGRLTGAAVLQIAYPVRDAAGELLQVLLASLDLRRLINEYQDPTIDGMQLLLIDSRGTILVWRNRPAQGVPRPGESIAGQPLYKFATGSIDDTVFRQDQGEGVFDGGYIWAVTRPAGDHGTGVYVLAGAPRAGLVAAANARLNIALAIVGAALLGCVLAVWLIADWAITRPVTRMAALARRLGRGDLAARLDGGHPGAELGQLMTALNEMASSLERQRADIAVLDERLRQSQRMETIGQLTGGVAHDFNNMLTVIMGNAELLRDRLRTEPQLGPLAEMILAAGQRGADLTQRLLAFARKQALDPRVLDVNQRLAALDSLLRRALGEHVQVRLVPAPGLWLALVDPAQLDNAVLNLCLNGRDAMPGGGQLIIETANATVDAAYAATVAELKPGDYVLVTVSDTGSGIAPEHLSRVFEPFFTTKDVGKGTGLGLSMVWGFAKQSGGHVAIYSEPGEGTTVKLYLPRAPDDGPAAAAAVPQPGDHRGHETILLVEDDDLVREHVAAQLRDLGYQVQVASGGVQALALLDQGLQADLLFTDVVMPGLSGPQLARQVRERRPGMRVLFTSGYTANAIVHHGRLDAGVHLLTKPYRRIELAQAVRRVLDPDPGADRADGGPPPGIKA